MCVIFGYTGALFDTCVLIEGIKKLEYRGYDFWGLSFMAIAKGCDVDHHRNLAKSVTLE